MKLVVAMFVLLAGVLLAVDTPAIPTEITLANGTVLRNVTLVRWDRDSVLIRYTGGLAPIPFRNMAPESRKAWEAAKAAAPAVAQKAAESSARTISGQVFITTQGAGAYKFAGATVEAYPASFFQEARWKEEGALPSSFSLSSDPARGQIISKAWANALSDSKPIATTTTDADGKFSLVLPNADDLFIYCSTRRYVAGNTDYELWVHQLTKEELEKLGKGNLQLDLNGSNQQW